MGLEPLEPLSASDEFKLAAAAPPADPTVGYEGLVELRRLGTLLNTSYDDGTLAGAIKYDVLGMVVIVPPIPTTSIIWE